MDEGKKNELIEKIDKAFDSSPKGRALKATVEKIAECSAPASGDHGAPKRPD